MPSEVVPQYDAELRPMQRDTSGAARGDDGYGTEFVEQMVLML